MNNSDIKGNRQIFLCTSVPLAQDFSQIDFIAAAAKIAKAAGLTTAEWNSYHYSNGGGTYIWFLSESHIAIDTYPEYHLVEITLLSCKAFDTAPVVNAIMDCGWIIRDYSNIEKNSEHVWQRS